MAEVAGVVGGATTATIEVLVATILAHYEALDVPAVREKAR